MASQYPNAKPYGKPTGGSATRNSVKLPKGPAPARFTGSQNFSHHFNTSPTDQVPSGAGGLPSQFLVTPYTDQQIQTMAHGRADADVAAGLAALPTADQVSHPYQQASDAAAGLTAALVQALQGTQHYQVGMAPAISGQYAGQAQGAQAGADAAAAALGGQAQQLAGSTGGAATALAVPAVAAANAQGGVIDAANLRGTNEQLLLNDRLAQALTGLTQQQAGVRAKGVSAFDDYVDQLNQQNHQIESTNTTNSLNYAKILLDQQRANSQDAYYQALIDAGNANRAGQNQRTQATIAGQNYRTTVTANETKRHDLATEAIASYRAQHPTSAAGGNARNQQGYTPSQITTHLGSDINRLRTTAANAHKPQGAVAGHQTVNVAYEYHPFYSGTSTVNQHSWKTGVAHVTPQAYQQFLQSGGPGNRNWSTLGVASHPGITKTQASTVGTPGHGPRPSQGYWETLRQVQSALETDNATYGYGLNPAQLTQYAQRIMREAGWNPTTPTPTPTGGYNGPH